MLKSLYISSFIIIDELRVNFDEGMSVLTGETGAGKSIIIDALGQLCGNRTSTSLIKKKASKAIIEGIFDVIESEELKKICEKLHIELEEEFVITKEILSSGKSNVKINYQNASINALKLLMPYLIDIHSQFETQKLFEEKNHIILLDQYANDELKLYIHQYKDIYQKYKEISSHLNHVIEEDMSDEQLDFLQSQLNEIEESMYTDEEIEEFESELKLLQNYEKINENIQQFDFIMNSSNGVLTQMKEALHTLQILQDYEEFNESYDKMYDYYYNIQDEHENIMSIYNQFHFDEYRFNELQDILFKVNRLKRKYGYTMERINEYRIELIEKIDNIKHRDEYIHSLQKEQKEIKNECIKLAENIHTIRKKYAVKFEKAIIHELKDLYLEKANFKVDFEKTHLNNQGIDKICFKVAINKGQDYSLLNESASGGEISRIMLAIKTVILSYGTIDTIVFDEVDTGVSGKVARSIGNKMLNLSKSKQVICITHLPQVASLAHHHYSIEKEMNNEETVTSMKRLHSKERIIEIAKMLSSEKITDEAIENAKQLLNV